MRDPTRGVHRWIGAWLRDRARKAIAARPEGERHLLVAICDHFEPLHGRATRELGRARVRAWREDYPRLASRFRDADGRPPRHTFFFPCEDYDAALVEPLAEMVERGLGEVEVHLHHDGDTRDTLRAKIAAAIDALDSHGIVPRRAGGRAWGFVHGNWALANGRPDGRWCGVDDELRLLFEMGCYADFTFPSAPDPCQPCVVNAIAWPRDDSQRRAYDDCEPARAGAPRCRDRVLLVQGPLAIARRMGRGVRALPLRIDAGAIDAGDPPSVSRLVTWMRQWVHVAGRPEWTFVKLHAHGATERNARVMLGEPMARLHGALGDLRGWRVHYVTAREMYNVARAAIDGRDGSPCAYFDYDVAAPERARARPV